MTQQKSQHVKAIPWYFFFMCLSVRYEMLYNTQAGVSTKESTIVCGYIYRAKLDSIETSNMAIHIVNIG